MHATTLDHGGYAFPHDDVAPTGGADQSGAVASASGGSGSGGGGSGSGSGSPLTVSLSSVH